MGTAWHHGAGGGASSNTHVQHYNDLKIKIYGKMDRSPSLEGKLSDFSSLSDFPLCPRLSWPVGVVGAMLGCCLVVRWVIHGPCYGVPMKCW